MKSFLKFAFATALLLALQPANAADTAAKDKKEEQPASVKALLNCKSRGYIGKSLTACVQEELASQGTETQPRTKKAKINPDDDADEPSESEGATTSGNQ